MPAAQPNVVFIFADQLSARHCGPYGNEHVRTPTMDRMAERGVVFENFYANSALCGPSRFSTFTGQMPFAHPLWAQPNCVGLPNLPYMGHLMRNAGYATASIGKLHGMPEDFDFGFEHCRINWDLHGKFPFNAYGRWVDQRLAERTDGEKLRELFQQPHDGGFGESLTDEQYQYVPPELSEEAWLLDETERFLQDRATGRPFFLHLGIQHPHHPWETIPREDERYDPEAMPLPPNFESDSPIAAALRDAKQQGKADGRDGVDPEEKRRRRRRTVARYYSSVTQVDKAIGRVFDMLQAHGVADNTVVVLARRSRRDARGARPAGQDHVP